MTKKTKRTIEAKPGDEIDVSKLPRYLGRRSSALGVIELFFKDKPDELPSLKRKSVLGYVFGIDNTQVYFSNWVVRPRNIPLNPPTQLTIDCNINRIDRCIYRGAC